MINILYGIYFELYFNILLLNTTDALDICKGLLLKNKIWNIHFKVSKDNKIDYKLVNRLI